MRKRIVPVLAAFAATLALAACSATATDQGSAATTDMMQPDSVAAAPMEAPSDEKAVSGEGTVGGESTQQQSVIRTAYISIRVDDVGATAAGIRSLVTSRRGLISAEDSRVTGDQTYSSMTVQVPAAQLDDFLADVSALGDVDSVNVTAQDVTTQVVDLDARISALQASIDRMKELLAQADQIDDLLAIETQLSARQAELDSLTAQRTWLADQVALSSVTVTLSPRTTLTEVDAPGFLSGLRSGWAAFASASAIGVTAAGFLLPFGIILALVLIPLVAIAIRQGRRRNQQHRTSDATPREPVGSSRTGD